MDQDNKTLNKIFEDSATPNKGFVEGLNKSLMSEFNNDKPQSNIISLFTMKLPSNTLKIGVIALSALLFLGVVGSVGYYAYNTYIKAPMLAKNQDILAQIAARKTLDETNNKTQAPALPSANGTTSADKMALIAPGSINRDYNYSINKTTYDIGPSSSKCTLMLPYSGDITSEESTQYYDNKDDYFAKYSKYVVYKDGDIYDYSLTNNSDQWVYKGGSYAVKLTNNQIVRPLAALEEPTSTGATAPDANTTTSTDQQPSISKSTSVEDMFGPDAKILGTVKKDGKEYYKIQWSYNTSCTQTIDKDTVSSSNDTPVVSIALADSKTFEIVEEQLYISKVSEGNRIYTRSTSTTSKSVSFEDVKSEFTFDFPVEVKSYDVSKYDYAKEQRIAYSDYLTKSNLDVVYMGSTSYKLQSLGSSYVTIVPDDEKYLIDRSFYSSKPYGEKMYQDSKDMFSTDIDNTKVNPVLQLSYSNDKATDASWVTLSEYDNQYNQSKILEGLYSQAKSSGTINITVEDNLITGYVYEYSNTTEPGSSGSADGVNGVQVPEMAPDSVTKTNQDTSPDTYTEYIVIFIYQGRSYAVQTSTTSIKKLSTVLNFKLAQSSKAINSVLTLDSNVTDKPVIMY